MIKFLKGLKNAVSPDYWANRIMTQQACMTKLIYGKKGVPWYIHLILMFVIIVLIFLYASFKLEHHVHTDQVGTDGDDRNFDNRC